MYAHVPRRDSSMHTLQPAEQWRGHVHHASIRSRSFSQVYREVPDHGLCDCAAHGIADHQLRLDEEVFNEEYQVRNLWCSPLGKDPTSEIPSSAGKGRTIYASLGHD